MNARRLMTPVFRVSFPKLFTPEGFDGGPPKYSVVALIQKDLKGRNDELYLAMIAEANRVGTEKFQALYDKLMQSGKLKWPIHEGEEKDLDGYGPDVMYLTLSSKIPPGVIGRRKETLAEADVYAGCYARATVNCFAWEFAPGGKIMNRGVSFGLGNVQKVGEGEPFSGGAAADAEFDEADNDVFTDAYEDECPFE